MALEIENFDIDYHFASPIFRFNKPEFLENVKNVFNDYVNQVKNSVSENNPYPGVMTDLISGDERIEGFLKYVSDISWDVLNKQGYNMDLFYTDASEMWGQYHPFTSSMDKHLHGHGSYLSGFYFLDTPENSSQMFIHDPRTVKVFSDLPIRPSDKVTSAESLIYYNPKPGDLFFTNSWLEHSFTRNASQSPFNFIHINVRVVSRDIKPDQQDGPIVV